MPKTKESPEFDSADQRRRDELLHKLLKTPPQPRPKREREKPKPKPKRGAKKRGT